jgi:DNA topoisomerase-1
MHDLTLERALGLLQFPRVLGKHDGEEVTVLLGRFGPYMKCGTQTVSLPQGVEPGQIELPQAVTLLTEAKENRQKAQEPLKTFGADPVSAGVILVKAGRYGPYVTDGTTNASLPKSLSPDTITESEAIEVLAKKRAAGPSKRGWGRKATGAKRPAGKKSRG